MGINSRIFEELREYQQQVIEGEISPLKAYIELKSLSEAVKVTIDNINENVIKEVSREPEKQGLICSGFCAKVQQKTTWKFDHIEKWVDEKQKLSAIEEQAKKIYQLQSSLNVNSEFENGGVATGVVNEQTGEIMTPAIREMSKPFIKLDKLK
jgi:hypothetical protein